MSDIEYMPLKQAHLRYIPAQEGRISDSAFYNHPGNKDIIENNPGLSAWVNHRCIAGFGIVDMGIPGRYVAWAFISRDAGPHLLKIVRKLRFLLDNHPYHRVEMHVACDFPNGHKLARLVGFEVEAQRMRKSGIRKEDQTLYARVK